MVSLVAGVIAAGYTLVYAAVANGGRLAEQPWLALVEDAYSGPAPSDASFVSKLVGKVTGFLHDLSFFGFPVSLPGLP